MMKRFTALVLAAWLGWLVLPGVATACPLCYGGDDPATGRATLWAGAVLVTTVYGLLASGAVWSWHRVRQVRSTRESEG